MWPEVVAGSGRRWKAQRRVAINGVLRLSGVPESVRLLGLTGCAARLRCLEVDQVGRTASCGKDWGCACESAGLVGCRLAVKVFQL